MDPLWSPRKGSTLLTIGSYVFTIVLHHAWVKYLCLGEFILLFFSSRFLLPSIYSKAVLYWLNMQWQDFSISVNICICCQVVCFFSPVDFSRPLAFHKTKVSFGYIDTTNTLLNYIRWIHEQKLNSVSIGETWSFRNQAVPRALFQIVVLKDRPALPGL